MSNVVSFALFEDFHTEGSGSVFNANQLQISINNCKFCYCTAETSAACFFFNSSTVNISKTCFYHSQISKQRDFHYGNAFHLENCNPAFYESLSAYKCGYDDINEADSTFATTSTQFTAKITNSSYCASYQGASSYGIDTDPFGSKMDYLTCINAYGKTAYVHTVINGKTQITNLNVINCDCYHLFYTRKDDEIKITNGVFIGNSFGNFDCNSYFDNFDLIEWYADFSNPNLTSLKPIDSINHHLFIDETIYAEFCNNNFIINQKINTIKIKNNSIILQVLIFVIILY